MRNNATKYISAQTNVAGPTNLAKYDIGQVYACSFIAVFTDGSAAGTLKLQVSNDECAYGNMAQDFVPTNWVDLAGATVSVTTGGVVIIPKTEVAYRWIRLVWTRSAGAGTFDVYINTQGF